MAQSHRKIGGYTTEFKMKLDAEEDDTDLPCLGREEDADGIFPFTGALPRFS